MQVDEINYLIRQGEGLLMSPTLSDGTWKDVLHHLVPNWHQNGTQLVNEKVPTSDKKGANLSKFKLAEYQEHMRFHFEKVPTSVEKGANLIAKKYL
jgi:hypothetical protein